MTSVISGDLTYEVTITPSATAGEFLITGFGAFDNPVISVRAIIIDEDNFELVDNVDYQGVDIEGTTTGTLNTSTTPATMAIEYAALIDGQPVTDNCTLILTQQ